MALGRESLNSCNDKIPSTYLHHKPTIQRTEKMQCTCATNQNEKTEVTEVTEEINV